MESITTCTSLLINDENTVLLSQSCHETLFTVHTLSPGPPPASFLNPSLTSGHSIIQVQYSMYGARFYFKVKEELSLSPYTNTIQ